MEPVVHVSLNVERKNTEFMLKMKVYVEAKTDKDKGQMWHYEFFLVCVISLVSSRPEHRNQSMFRIDSICSEWVKNVGVLSSRLLFVNLSRWR